MLPTLGPTRTGTHGMADLFVVTRGSVIEFDEAKAYEIVRTELAAHNAAYEAMAGELMLVTPERLLTYGNDQDTEEMQELSETSRTVTELSGIGGGTIGLPMRKFGKATGWTRDALLEITPAELANRIVNIETADIKNLYRQVRGAFFNPTSQTVRDVLVDRAELNVKPLLNGDGQPIASYEGASFPGTHTHYLASATWDEGLIDDAIQTVREHGHTGNIVVYVNATSQGQLTALSKFTPAQRALITPAQGEAVANVVLDNSRDNNRIIGVWDGLYYVHTKPWVPAGYVLVMDSTAAKPLAMRVPVNAGLRGLRLVANIELYPLRVDYYEHRFGVGCFTRTAAAVIDMGSAVYRGPIS